jgi:5-methylcytosine-specific restriction endonuclease McrA
MNLTDEEWGERIGAPPEPGPGRDERITWFLPRRLTADERRRLASMTYEQYLGTRHWRQRRERSLVLADHRCERCGARSTLQVHHRTYERLGEELDEDLEVLCDRCHAAEHGITNEPSPAKEKQ